MIEKRRFGRTDMQVPRVTFGGGWVGGVLIHGDRETAFAALDMAVDAGIDWIDTAALYGNGVSETVIGEWLAQRADVDLSGISTKFRVDPAQPDLRGQMLKTVEASLKRLGRNSVDLIIQHNKVGREVGYGAKEAIEMAEIMEDLRAQGLCKHLGMSALGDPTDLKEIVKAGAYDVAQVYYNALNPTAAEPAHGAWNTTNFDGLLGDCAAQDMGVMGIRIFAAGHLATDKRHGREIPITANSEDQAEEARASALASAWSDIYGAPAQAALRFGLACDALSTIVVGLGEVEHLSLAIAATAEGPLPTAGIEAAANVRAGPAFTD